MSTVILEYFLPDGAALIVKDSLVLDLGNGVTLRSSLPTWVKVIHKATLKIELEIEGSPDAPAQKQTV